MDAFASTGTIVAVRGAVVDVSFAATALPAINTALIVHWDRPEPLILEVHSHADPNTVRSLALQATAGLARGVKVEATGAPISAPVGPGVLGEVLHDTSPLLAGGVVALLFAASAVAQVMLRVTPHLATLPIGCGTLIVGVALLTAAVLLPSLAFLIASAIVTGLGQGLVVGAGLPAVTSRTSAERRGEVASLYFVVCYVGLCLPVIGVGLLAQRVTLAHAAVVFSAAVALVTAAALMRIRAVTAA